MSLIAAAALTGGCFNPESRDETGTTTAGTTGSPGTTTTTASADNDTGSSTIPDGTTTTDLPPTSTTSTTSTTDEETTAAAPHAEFVPRTPIAFTGAYVIVTAALDEDPPHDLVVSSAAPLNPEFASYIGPALDTVTPHPSGVALAFTGVDLDLDDDTDIVAALVGNPAVVTAFRRVDPIFLNSAGTVLPVSCSSPNWLAVGQLNPDTDNFVDVVITCSDLLGAVLIVPGAVNGSFDAPKAVDHVVRISSVGLAQVRGSPALDLVLVSNLDNVVHVVPGADDLNFDPALTQVIPVSAPLGFATGDLDGDAYTDFGVVSQMGGCPLVHGAATDLSAPEIHPCGTGAVDLVLGDLNRDKLTDLVSIHPGELHIAYGDVDGTIGAPDILSAAAAPLRVTLGDYDGDTLPDIALTATDQILVFFQTPG